MHTEIRSKTASLLAGVSLRAAHIEQVLAHRPEIAWLEVHPENYMADAAALAALQRIRDNYPLSLHAVGLSLGTAGPFDPQHSKRLATLIDRLEPALVSDHLSWSTTGTSHLNDLLPLPYTEEALITVANNIDRVQERIGRQLLIENPSSYLRFKHSSMSEADFLCELVRRTECGLLLDLNNLYVSAHNVGVDPAEHFAVLPRSAIKEFHLAGHARNRFGDDVVLIDDHGSRVCDEVWNLYVAAVKHFGPRPTLIEWDNNIPTLEVLCAEAARARFIGAMS